jgi:hypothetical protein
MIVYHGPGGLERRRRPAAAKAKGLRLGGRRAQSVANKTAATERGEISRPVFAELAALSANKAAVECTEGKPWLALTVIGVRAKWNACPHIAADCT